MTMTPNPKDRVFDGVGGGGLLGLHMVMTHV
jgi:hypothetical protein